MAAIIHHAAPATANLTFGVRTSLSIEVDSVAASQPAGCRSHYAHGGPSQGVTKPLPAIGDR